MAHPAHGVLRAMLKDKLWAKTVTHRSPKMGAQRGKGAGFIGFLPQGGGRYHRVTPPKSVLEPQILVLF